MRNSPRRTPPPSSGAEPPLSEAAYRAAIARTPAFPSAYLGLAILLRQSGRPAEALLLLDHARRCAEL